MDKYEYRVRADEIKDLIARGDYSQAAEIADTIDWRRVKSVMMLCTISDLYKINRRYEDAKNMLLLAYERRPGGKTICYSLCELCIKTEEFIQAVNYYKEFVQVAPKDPGRYILQYKLYEAQEVGLEERIGVLEELKKRDYREKWAYELAYLYHRVGLATRCVEECDELILWFGDGKYVIKAMELKMLHQPLSAAQQEKYDHRFDSPKPSGAVQMQGAGSPRGAREGRARIVHPVEGAGQGQPAWNGQASGAGEQPDWEGQSAWNGQASGVEEQPGWEGQSAWNGQASGAGGQSGWEGQPAWNGQASGAGEQPGWEGQPAWNGQASGAGEQPGWEGQPAWNGQASGAGEQPGWEGQSAWNGQASGVEEQPGWEGQSAWNGQPSGTGEQSGWEGQSAWNGQASGVEEQPGWEGQPAWNGQASGAGEQPGWEGQPYRSEVSSDTRTDWVLSGHKPAAQETVPVAEQTEELDIQVKTMDMGAYNTLNLQAEIAAGLQEVLAEDRTQSDAITRSILAPLLDSDTESLDMPEIDEVDESDLEPEKEVMEGTEVFFGETGELGNVQKEEKQAPKWIEEVQLNAAPTAEPSAEKQTERASTEEKTESAGIEKAGIEKAAAEEAQEKKAEIEEVRTERVQTESAGSPEEKKKSAAGGEKGDESSDKTAVIVMNQLRMESMGQGEEQVLTAQPPKEIAGVLSQESDGQISLVVPESEKIEKQITGQMSIEDVLDEWEKLKKESEARRQEEVRQHVLEQTGNMFSNFEESVKDGLLEQLESEPVEESAEDEPVELVELEGQDAAAAVDGGALESGDTEPPTGEEEVTDEEVIEAEAADEEVTDEEASEEEAADEESAEEEPVELVELEEQDAADADEGAHESKDTEPPTGEEEVTDEEVIEAEAAEEEIAGEETAEEESAETEKSKLRALTREEKELYAPFIQSRASRERLIRTIDNISLAAYTGNIIITGEEGMDTLSLAKNMIREVQMTDSNFSGKVAKVSGQGLNSKNVEETLERLESGALIVQKASEMKDSTIELLQKVLQKDNFGIIIVLEDTKRAMEKLLKAYPELKESFTARMDVEAMSNDSLVAFGRQYAREREYSIDELGVLALHTRIEERQTIDHAVTAMEVKDIVDEGIRSANRKTLGHFFDILLARRYDEEDMIILTEKDFV